MKKVWIGKLPEICGYGVFVICKNEKDAEKYLRKGYNDLAKGRRKYWSSYDEYWTFEGAMEYFSGSVYPVDFNEIMDNI